MLISERMRWITSTSYGAEPALPLPSSNSTLYVPYDHISILTRVSPSIISSPPFSYSPRSAIANQESLSILEVEMRKLEGVVKEIVDELGYLQRREAKMRDTNGQCSVSLTPPLLSILRQFRVPPCRCCRTSVYR